MLLCYPRYSMEQAGGSASTGTKRMLDLMPDKIHARSPIFLGSAEDVKDLEGFYQQYPN